jgi:hypothetical protein
MALAKQKATWEQTAWIAYHVHAWSMAKKKMPYWQFNPFSEPQVPGRTITEQNFEAVTNFFVRGGKTVVMKADEVIVANPEDD